MAVQGYTCVSSMSDIISTSYFPSAHLREVGRPTALLEPSLTEVSVSGQCFQAWGRIVRVSCAGLAAGLGDLCVSSLGYSMFLEGRSNKVELG